MNHLITNKLKMRSFIACLLVFVFHLNNFVHSATEAQLKSAGKLLRNNCQPKTKVTDEQIENMHKGIWDDEPTTQCYAYCLMNMYKLVDKAGKFNMESAMKQMKMLPEPRQAPVLKSLENCLGKDEGSTKCESAYYFLKCFYFDNPENYFAP